MDGPLSAVTGLFPPQHILPQRSHAEALFTRTQEEERSPHGDRLFTQSIKPERDEAFFAWISCLTYLPDRNVADKVHCTIIDFHLS